MIKYDFSFCFSFIYLNTSKVEYLLLWGIYEILNLNNRSQILCLKMKCPSPRNPESPKQDKPKAKHPRHILIKLTKIKHKEQILKAATEKQQTTHKGIPIRITADLSIETLQARKEWQDILKVMKENNLQPRLLYPARISFKYEGESKSFTDKQKLREFSTIKPALQQILKDIL